MIYQKLPDCIENVEFREVHTIHDLEIVKISHSS
jgi:hypothetical protein